MMTSPEDCERRVGTVLKGKWTLERVLGVGGMAAVYVGRHTIGRRSAIKILHPELARDAEIRARFELEAHATNRFRHEGAVDVQDYDVSEDNCPFLVMELLEGESLGDRARRTGEVPIPELLRVACDVLDVLEAAHQQGIVHRDIKLENVFLQSDGRTRVLDFGVARLRSSAIQTQLGARLGTTPYMSPEQVRGGDVDGRADVFAVGVVLFRLITKRKVHEAPSENELVIKMATDRAPKIRSIAPDVPEDLALVIDHALEYLAADRYPNARTMRDDLNAVRAGERPAFVIGRAAAAAAAAAASASARAPMSAYASAETLAPGSVTGVATMEPRPSQAVTAFAPPPVSARTAAAPPSSAYAPVSVAIPAPTSASAPVPLKPPRNNLLLGAYIFSGALCLLGAAILLATRDCGADDRASASASASAAQPTSSAPSTARATPPAAPSSDAADLLRRVRDVEKKKKP